MKCTIRWLKNKSVLGGILGRETSNASNKWHSQRKQGASTVRNTFDGNDLRFIQIYTTKHLPIADLGCIILSIGQIGGLLTMEGTMMGSEQSGEANSRLVGTIQKQIVVKLDAAWNDARKLVKNDGQLSYVGDVFERLEDFGNLDETSDLMILKVHGRIWELIVKHFILSELSLGICFAHIKDRSELLVLGVVDAPDGSTLKPFQIVKMERRLAYYLDELAE